MSASNGRLVIAAKAGNSEEVSKLLSIASANVNYAEWNGDTALSVASNFGHMKVVQILVEKGADANSKDKKGETALMQACNKGFLEISLILLENGANVNNQSKLGYTALMGASINGRRDLVELLISKGADCALKTNEGKTAADFAKSAEIRAVLETHVVPDEAASSFVANAAENVTAECSQPTAPLSAEQPPTAPEVPSDATISSSSSPKRPMPPTAKPRPPPARSLPPFDSSSAAVAPASVPAPPSSQAPLPPPPPSSTEMQDGHCEPPAAAVVEVLSAEEPAQDGRGDREQRSVDAEDAEGGDDSGPPEAPSVAKRLATSQLLHQLIVHCECHDHNHGKLPYRAFRDRIAHLKHIYCGEGGLLEVAARHNQECVPEYFALRLEKHLQDAMPHVDPRAKRSYITLAGMGDRKTLLKFTETDRSVTQCMRELVEAMHALQIANLSAALDVQHRLGPELIYELQIHEDTAIDTDFALHNDTEDPHTPLLHPSHRSPLENLTSMLAGGRPREKDGRIQSLNLSRATVAPKARRAPTRRKFKTEAGEDSSLHDLLAMIPSMADITTRLSASVPSNWKQFFGVDGDRLSTGGAPAESAGAGPGIATTKVNKIPEEWFELPSDAAGPAKSHVPSAADDEAEARKWARLDNLAEGTHGPSSCKPPAPRSPAPVHVQDTVSSPLLGGEQSSSARTTPKRISNSLIAKLGGFDPTKVKPPGRSPSLDAYSPASPVHAQGALATESATSNTGIVQDGTASRDANTAAGPALPNLDRATNQKARRAPAKRRFELKDGETPTLIAPLPVSSATAAAQQAPVTPKTPSTIGSTLKSLFKARPSMITTAAIAAPTDAAGSTGAGSCGKPEPASSLQLPAVLQDGPQSAAATTPKTPSAGISGMLGNLAAGMSLLGGKSRKQSVTTHSAGLAAAQSHSIGQGIDGGDILKASKIVVQNMALAAESLPIIGAAAVLMLQLIDLCDAYRCNKKLFESLKARMTYMYKLYFAEGGVADIAHRKGKDSVVEPFARHLEVIILDAIDYLTAFTEKGFFHKLLSGRRPQQRFAEIDSDVTKCLDGLTVALQLLQIADLSTALENLQMQKKTQEDIYDVVTDVQRRVDVNGGLHGVKSMNHAQLQELCEELGVRDATELREEVSECQERIEVAVDKVSENVREIKSAVADGNKQFVELKEMISELHHQTNHAHHGSDHIDLSLWKLREAPQIDRKLLLGSGSFGSVFAGSYLGRQAAFKLPNRNAGVLQVHHNPALHKEVRLHLRVCACPGVVQILAVALQANELTSEPCVIMERAIGSLYDYLHRYKRSAKFLPAINFSPTSKLTLTLQVASAMEYISAAGLIHRDIKASNVLLFFQGSCSAGGDPDVCAKICDFGLSKSTSLESSFEMSSHISVKGTPSYLAPEAFDAQYSSASDVYAYGVLLNETLTEHLPVPASVAGFMSPTIFQLRDAVCRDAERPVLYDETSSIGDSLRDLITHCWAQKPNLRCSFAQVTVELTHVLHASLAVAKYGTVQAEATSGKESASERYPTFSPLSSPHTARPVISTVPVVTAASATKTSSAATTQENCSSDSESLITATATTTAAETATTTVTAAENASSASMVATGPLRNLEDLSVSEVGALMDFIQLHPLREVLISHQVSGIMLSYCEGVEDLLSKEYGLASRGLAGGLMKKIQDWKVNGVPHC